MSIKFSEILDERVNTSQENIDYIKSVLKNDGSATSAVEKIYMDCLDKNYTKALTDLKSLMQILELVKKALIKLQ